MEKIKNNFVKSQSMVWSLFMGYVALTSISCEEFVEVPSPKNQLTANLVFEDSETVDAAYAHIYSLLRERSFTTGTVSGISFVLGHYSDELELYSNVLNEIQEFNNGRINPSNSIVEALWNESYSLVYVINNIIEGVERSAGLSKLDKERFLGEGYFLRAYVHFHLINLFGVVPYIDSTDFQENSRVSKIGSEEHFPILVHNLELARELLSLSSDVENNFRPNQWTATAFLARVYLYYGEWTKALEEANKVLENSTYQLSDDLSAIFRKDSPETIWQLDSGISGSNTHEGKTFIFNSGPPPNSSLRIDFIEKFEPGDNRMLSWVGSVTDGVQTWYYPNKYKLNSITPSTEECSVLIRLAELYLIAAEANAQLGNSNSALESLNQIRKRTSLPPLPDTDGEELLDAIFHERKIEFFTELGHSFFDLKRSGLAVCVLSPIKSEWKATSINLPIPESELILNPNLQPQNEGY